MFGVRVLRLLAVPRGHDERHPAPLRGRVARRRPGDPRPTAPPASRGLHRRNPALPAAGRAPADHRSRPRQHGAHVSEPVLAAARSVLSPRARSRPLLRHDLPHSSGRGPGPDRPRVQGPARSRERAGSLITSLVGRRGRAQRAGCRGGCPRWGSGWRGCTWGWAVECWAVRGQLSDAGSISCRQSAPRGASPTSSLACPELDDSRVQ